MSASPHNGLKLLGLFELDPAGMVLYSRVEPDWEPGRDGSDFEGLNFFDEVVPFSNVEEFRLRVTQFAGGALPADSFRFNCQYEAGALPVRVLLARIRERADDGRTKSVLVHIRGGE